MGTRQYLPTVEIEQRYFGSEFATVVSSPENTPRRLKSAARLPAAAITLHRPFCTPCSKASQSRSISGPRLAIFALSSQLIFFPGEGGIFGGEPFVCLVNDLD